MFFLCSTFFFVKIMTQYIHMSRKKSLHKSKWPTTDEKNMWVQKMGSVDGDKHLPLAERCSVLGGDSCDELQGECPT